MALTLKLSRDRPGFHPSSCKASCSLHVHGMSVYELVLAHVLSELNMLIRYLLLTAQTDRLRQLSHKMPSSGRAIMLSSGGVYTSASCSALACPYMLLYAD